MPLTTTVTTLKQAIASNQSAVLVATAGWTDPAIKLPFSTNRNGVSAPALDAKGDQMTLNMAPGTPFGSLQTTFDGNRSLLVATSNGAPGQLDELLSWLAAERGRWSGLDGQALVTVAGAQPVTIPNPPPPEELPPEPESRKLFSARSWVWWAGGGVVALAAIGAAVIVFKVRRSHRRAARQAADQDSGGGNPGGDHPEGEDAGSKLRNDSTAS